MAMAPVGAPTPAQGSCTQLTQSHSRTHTFTMMMMIVYWYLFCNHYTLQGLAEDGIRSGLQDWIGLLLSMLFGIVAGYGVAVVFDDRQQDRQISSQVHSRPVINNNNRTRSAVCGVCRTECGRQTRDTRGRQTDVEH